MQQETKSWHRIKRTRNAMVVDRARKGREVVYHYPMYFPRRASCIATSPAVKISHFGTSRHYNIFLVWLISSTVDSISTFSYLISENDASHSSARRHRCVITETWPDETDNFLEECFDCCMNQGPYIYCLDCANCITIYCIYTSCYHHMLHILVVSWNNKECYKSNQIRGQN